MEPKVTKMVNGTEIIIPVANVWSAIVRVIALARKVATTTMEDKNLLYRISALNERLNDLEHLDFPGEKK